jgi:hypothetical protein
VRAAAPAQPARRHAAVDPQCAAVMVEPDEVEREAHPEGVDGPRPLQQQRGAARRVEAGEAAQPRQRRRRAAAVQVRERRLEVELGELV